MRIGTCIGFERMAGIEGKLARLHDNGFDTCQLLSWSPSVWTDENVEIMKGLLQKYGITVSSFWCGWEGPWVWDFYDGQLTLGLVPVEYRQMRIQNLCDGADFAHKLGIKNVATHMGFIPENPNDPNFGGFCVAVRTVAQHLKKNGQYLLFETGQETPVTLLRCFEKVGEDNLGVNLDTGNLILYGKANPVDALDTIGTYVKDIHAKDGRYPTNGKDLGCETRLGEGKVDFKALFVKLHELGYNGAVNIEREIPEGSEEQRKDVVAAKKYLQDIIEEVYGEESLC